MKLVQTFLMSIFPIPALLMTAGSISDLQQLVDKVHTTSSRFGLRVSSTKTEVQFIGRGRQDMGNSELMQCEQFVYLRGVISECLSYDKDVT